MLLWTWKPLVRLPRRRSPASTQAQTAFQHPVVTKTCGCASHFVAPGLAPRESLLLEFCYATDLRILFFIKFLMVSWNKEAAQTAEILDHNV